MSAFDTALAWVFEYEGVHAHDPADPGGDTYYGIARASHPHLEPWPPTREQAAGLYRAEYWDACQCDALPTRLAIALFDAAVNQGPGWAPQALQRALGVAPDGTIGPQTIAAAFAADTKRTLARFLMLRALRYAELAEWPIYRDNWMLRLFLVHQLCLLGAA